LSAVAVDRPRRRRLPPITKITFGVIAFVGVGLVLKGAISPGPAARCVTACSRPPAAVGGGEAFFTSRTYGFQFGYPSVGKRINVGGKGVTGVDFYDTRGSFAGQMLVSAGLGHQPLSYLVDHEAKQLGSFDISNLNLSAPMNGAEIGFDAGAGNMYTGAFTDSLGNVHPVDVGVIAVQRGNEWVSMVGIGAISGSNSVPLVFSVFDDTLDQWRWTR
jgi:hypothetical protein